MLFFPTRVCVLSGDYGIFTAVFIDPQVLHLIFLIHCFIDISQFLNFYLVGDFNVNMSDASHPLYHRVCNLMDSFSLSQVVTGHTHTSPTGRDSLIDL